MTNVDVTVTTNAPYCLPPRWKDSVAQGQTVITLSWPCSCVRPNASVTISVQADAEATFDSEFWYSSRLSCPAVLPTSFHVSEVDGDQDGYPDTSETFDLQVTLRNYSEDLTNVVARIVTEDPKIDCASPSSVVVGSIPFGGVVDLPTPFRLHVHPAADRGGLVPPVACIAGSCSNGAGSCSSAAQCTRTTIDDYSAAVTVSLFSDQNPYGQTLPPLDTYGLSQMDALRIKNVVSLAARVCRDDPAPTPRACNSASDCAAVGGGPCVTASPELSFKHQISTMDVRFAAEDGEALDRAVVQVQVSGSTVWRKLSPYQNVYDVQGPERPGSNCFFDPIDDGNTEDDLDNSSYPSYDHVGPSSTCWPEFSFSLLGDTDEPYGADHLGRATGGLGLPGSAGIGTWVESRFDLSRFRGRSVRLRWLFTSVKISDYHDWGNWVAQNPLFHDIDDGWYFDDVRVSETLGTSSTTVALDSADNSALGGNADGDARGDDCDCAPLDPSAFTPPGEVPRVLMLPDESSVDWASQAARSGTGTTHDVLRGMLSGLPVGGAGEACVASEAPSPPASDPDLPPSGAGYWYVVRARNACGIGPYGFLSGGVERVSGACP